MRGMSAQRVSHISHRLLEIWYNLSEFLLFTNHWIELILWKIHRDFSKIHFTNVLKLPIYSWTSQDFVRCILDQTTTSHSLLICHQIDEFRIRPRWNSYLWRETEFIHTPNPGFIQISNKRFFVDVYFACGPAQNTKAFSTWIGILNKQKVLASFFFFFFVLSLDLCLFICFEMTKDMTNMKDSLCSTLMNPLISISYMKRRGRGEDRRKQYQM